MNEKREQDNIAKIKGQEKKPEVNRKDKYYSADDEDNSFSELEINDTYGMFTYK